MSQINVPVVFNPNHLDSEKDIPAYATEGASGMDIRADIPGEITIMPGERAFIRTGIYMAIPDGYECQVRPRSGLAARKGLTVLNSPGTIDSDFSGECCVILINTGKEIVSIEQGERIAQFVFAPVVRANLVRSNDLPKTKRGAGGFGSTGTK